MLTRKNLSAEEIIAHQEKIYALYKNVCDRAGFKLLSISPNYFFTLKKHLHNDFQLKAYFYQGELVAFISYFIEKKVTETHFIGFDEKDNNTWAIYQNILYDMVAEGIAQQTNTLALGRTALEVKSTIGATGVPMNNFIWSKNLVLHAASQKLFQWLNQHEWTPRNPFK